MAELRLLFDVTSANEHPRISVRVVPEGVDDKLVLCQIQKLGLAKSAGTR